MHLARQARQVQGDIAGCVARLRSIFLTMALTEARLASAPFAATVTSSSWLADLRKGGRGRIRHVYMANGLPQTLMGPPILFP